MDTLFEKSQALFGEQAEWFAGHASKMVETMLADSDALVRTMREGMEAAVKNQGALMEQAFDQVKTAAEAHTTTWRDAFTAKKAE